MGRGLIEATAVQASSPWAAVKAAKSEGGLGVYFQQSWNDSPSAEGILQIRAAALCDDDRLTTYLDPPGSPFHPNVQNPALALAA